MNQYLLILFSVGTVQISKEPGNGLTPSACNANLLSCDWQTCGHCLVDTVGGCFL